jgi:hypothetical protein
MPIRGGNLIGKRRFSLWKFTAKCVCVKQTFTIRSATSKSSTSFFPTSMHVSSKASYSSITRYLSFLMRKKEKKKRKKKKRKKKKECLFHQCSMPSVFSGLFVVILLFLNFCISFVFFLLSPI